MKLAIKSLTVITALLLAVSAFGYFFWYKPKFNRHKRGNDFAYTATGKADKTETGIRLSQKVQQAKTYLRDQRFNKAYCFLLDMRIPSGKKRFFVYNLEQDSVELAGLVTHGSGTGNNETGPVFSNTPNSNCTSLGRYRIGNSYTGKFGLAYKLYGLDKTNNRAFDRFVVLHAHACVPVDEIDPLPICESWGCPTVAPAFLDRLKTYLDAPGKPILLWIYY